MNRTFQKQVTVVFGFVLAGAMALSLVLPLLTQNIGVHNAAQAPTPIPSATPLPDIQDVSEISFDESYLHPSGLYSVGLPTDWTVSNNASAGNEAQLSVEHSPSESVTEVRVLSPSVEINSVEDLDSVFDDAWLQGSWRSYSAWEETNRFTEEDNHMISFNLELGPRSFIARQQAWYDGDWVYVVRVIAPDIGSDMLLHVLNGVSDSLQPNRQFVGTPINWNSYFDDSTRHIIRYPSTFNVTDSAVGAPATITSDDITMRVETVDGAISDEDAAGTWVTDWRSDATIQSVEMIESDRYNGYLVSYSVTTLDGVPQAGLAMLLNGVNEQVHVANMQVEGESNDLLDTAAFPDGNQYRDILETFTLLPEMEVATAE